MSSQSAGPTPLESINGRVVVAPASGCWLWQGAKKENGYGVVIHESRKWRVHRLVYTVMVGPIPEGLQIDHLCFVRECCNPAHLEAVTADENRRRRKNAPSRDQCKRGHPLVPGNLRYRADKPNWRVCLTCVTDAEKRAWERRKVRAMRVGRAVASSARP